MSPMQTGHISSQFDADLEAVHALVVHMGGLVEAQVVNAINALNSGDIELADEIIVIDRLVNNLESRIDENCIHIIARRQPAASDLRLLMTIVRTVTELERISDEAVKIARMTNRIYGSDRINLPRFSEIVRSGELAIDMLRKALDGFARGDASNTVLVVEGDKGVDDEFSSVLRYLITFMVEDPRNITSMLDIVFAAKAIEQIGDHVKNMSEYIVYLVKGKDVRHSSADEISEVLMEQ